MNSQSSVNQQQGVIASQAGEQVWTIKSILDWSAGYLKKSGSPTPRLDAEILLSKVVDMPRINLYVNFDRPLSLEEKSEFRDLLKRRANLEPVAYILGEKEFYGYTFSVDKHVLIPRPDTEHVVAWVEEYLKECGVKGGKDKQVRGLDIGTGSGCLAIATTKCREDVSFKAVDISEEALEVAIKNAENLDVLSKISFAKADALKEEFWSEAFHGEKKFDLIVSNPPYICRTETDVMAAETQRHEPDHALFAERKGLDFYDVFARKAKGILVAGGPIVVEIGYNQGDAVKGLFEENNWSRIQVLNDFSGLNRVVIAFNG